MTWKNRSAFDAHVSEVGKMPTKKTPTLAQLPHSPAPAKCEYCSSCEEDHKRNDPQYRQCCHCSRPFDKLSPAPASVTPASDEAIDAWQKIAADGRRFIPADVIDRLIARIESEKAEIAQLRAQRDEARATKDMHKERAEEAWEEVHRLQHQETERNHTLRARLAEVSEAASAFVSAYWDGDAHKKAEALEAILAKGDK